ncbi:MAG: sugar transferase, partial [Pseudomonadota bacterium]
MRFHAPQLPGNPEVTRQPADAARANVGTAPALTELAFAGPTLVSPSIVRGSARIGEFVLLSLFGFAIAFLYVPAPDLWASSQYLIALIATALLTVVFFEALGAYTVNALSSIVQPMSRLLLGWTMATGLLVAAVFFLKIGAEFSRVWLALWFGLGAMFLIAVRALFSVPVRHWVATGRLSRRAVVYGGGPSTGDLLASLAKDPRTDISVFGVFDDRTAARDGEAPATGEDQTAPAAGYPHLGTLEDLVAFARRARIDVIILNLPVTAETRMLEALSRLSVLPADIRIPAAASRVRFQPRTYSYIGDVPFIDVFDRPITDWGLVAKWAFDKVVAATAILLLAPVLAAIALAVRLESKGPVLFRQKRYGFNIERNLKTSISSLLK